MKVIFIQNYLIHYRVDFYEELSKYFEIIVIHSGKRLTSSKNNFKEIILPLHKIGPFFIQENLLSTLKEEEPDKIVGMFDIRWLSIVRSMFYFEKKIDWIWWGLDKGSYIADFFKKLLLMKSNKVVFYNKEIRAKYEDFNKNNFYVANNTIYVPDIALENTVNNDSFINVGSLHERKENEIAIHCFSKVLASTKKNLFFHLVGEGPEKRKLKKLAKDLDIENNVIFHGHIDSYQDLIPLYERSYASVSYGQAGLAVLQSIGFGTPFITRKNAISGGEIHNIVHGKNGYLVESQEEVTREMTKLVLDSSHQSEMKKFCFSYYKDNCSIESMGKTFRDILNENL